MNQVDFSDWLFSSEARQHLVTISTGFRDGLSALQIIKRLRTHLEPDAARRLMELHELRERGKNKFSAAESMFFSRVHLEQATSEWIAQYKARRYQGCRRIADLCCGIGGDAIALASIGAVDLVDIDPLVLEMARHNLLAHGLTGQVHCQPAECFDVTEVDAFHLDPDRRQTATSGQRQRTTDADWFSPTAEQVRELAAHNPSFGLKLAPATQFGPGDFEVEFIGHQRECKQQVIWSGQLMQQQGTRATVLDHAGENFESFFSASHPESGRGLEPASNVELYDYIHDPHPCLLASGLLREFARQHDLVLIDAQSRYLLAQKPLESMLVSGFRIRDVLKPDFKKIQQYLKQHDVGTVELKKRGKLDELHFRLSRLKLTGDQTLTAILTGTPQGDRAIMAERLLTTNSGTIDSD